GLALVISILLVYWLWRSPRVLSYRLALSAILGGALGNVADRLRLGYVEDFLDFHYAQWHWPSFNLADVWIFLGVALFIWAEIRHQPGSRRR
ncbi:MAG: signal peptidase II, partial [Halopseudomonas aestusnigri]|nr:signal peptidase II [Halopseudomonas aestusnigri]